MKQLHTTRSFVLLLAASLSIGLFAQSTVKINKVARAQQAKGKTMVVSTDSRLPRVLGTFDRPTDVNSLPAPVKEFLATYETAASQIQQGANPANLLSLVSASSTTADTVGPVLGGIMFDQGTPYNDKCPYLNGGRAVTGCVATAMAMVMAYYKYPAVGVGTANYTSSNGEATYNYADHPFDWANMLDTYSYGNYSGKQAAAVAELSFACGAAIHMDYSAGGSGTYTEYTVSALRDIFGYSSDIRFANRPDDEIAMEIDWIPQMQEQFDAGHPVIYAATGPGGIGGHCFIIDGYTVTGDAVYFHLNWGWSGHGNGWFLITRLAYEGNNYNSNQRMVFNIYPAGWTALEKNTNCETKVRMDQPVYTILGNKIEASRMQRGQIYIQNGRKFVW